MDYWLLSSKHKSDRFHHGLVPGELASSLMSYVERYDVFARPFTFPRGVFGRKKSYGEVGDVRGNKLHL